MNIPQNFNSLDQSVSSSNQSSRCEKRQK